MKRLKKRVWSNPVIGASLASGGASAILFNPYDRALFLSVKHQRPFLTRENFLRPMAGVNQAFLQKVVQGGVYFYFQEILTESLIPQLPHKWSESRDVRSFTVGFTAGSLNGLLTNWMSVVRFETWKNPDARFTATACYVYEHGGVKRFMRGLSPTILRDGVFGIFYEGLRRRFNSDNTSNPNICHNTLAAGIATVFSGPLNYARNYTYTLDPKQPSLPTCQVLTNLGRNAFAQESWLATFSFLGTRLRLGWGTGRVAVGMGFAQTFFDRAKSCLEYFQEPGYFDRVNP